MSARFATSFRNVNLGRPGSPSKAELLAAFSIAGATDVSSFLTDGNVVFSARVAREAAAIAERAAGHLRRVCGLAQPSFTRSLAHLADTVASDPFASAPADDVYQQAISVLLTGLRHKPVAPLATPRRDVEVFLLRAGEAFSVTRKVGGQAGYANGFLERVLGAQLTTRNRNAVVRLVERHA